MKVRKLIIKNIRKIKDVELNFDQPLVILYGEVEQGKTTFLDAIKILFSKGFPADLITHGEKEASIELVLESGVISRSFYVSKEGEIKGRAIKAIVDNQILKATDLQKMFNPFQLNQDFLKEMTAIERKRFFVDLFGIDTSTLDAEIKEKESVAKDLRAEIKGIGEIEVIEIEKPDSEAILKKLEYAKNNFVSEEEKINLKNKELKASFEELKAKELESIQAFNKEQREISDKNKTITDKAKALFHDFTEFKEFIDFPAIKEFIKKLNPAKEEKTLINTIKEPEFTTIDEKFNIEIDKIKTELSTLEVQEFKYEEYKKQLKKQADKDDKKQSLLKIEAETKALRLHKIAKLAEYGSKIEGLEFNESGTLVFEGSENDNLSTSQIVRLGSKVSSLFPDSLLDLELLDRAESLGKKIFDFIDKAKNENKTILATIVGETPATTPEDVGVFVVEDGNLLTK